MFSRQKAILRLVENEGGEVSKLRLVKLAFLLRHRSTNAPKSGVYEFLPYLHGPYSFTLSHEMRSLERHGWLRVMDKTVHVTDSSVSNGLDSAFRKEVDDLSAQFQGITTSRLISEVYREFPWFTAKAKDRERRAAEVPAAPRAVYTVGYEGLMLDGLLDLLLRSGLKRLIDVRCNPVARRFGFHRSTLERHCADVGLDYVHIPELGIPSKWRADLGSMRSYDRLFTRYEEEILPAQSGPVRAAALLVKEKPSALMCMEADCNCCHRTRLGRLLAKKTGLPLKELRE